jgi:hypothetical protein
MWRMVLPSRCFLHPHTAPNHVHTRPTATRITIPLIASPAIVMMKSPRKFLSAQFNPVDFPRIQ